MTKKSQSRRDRDAKVLQASGRKIPPATAQREKSTRVWFELKNVHKRSIAYIENTAALMQNYVNRPVLQQIERNGKTQAFIDLNLKMQTSMVQTNLELAELWDSHKDKKHLCKNSGELTEAFRIFEAYQVFDVDFYTQYSGIISELNVIFNEALSQLLEAQAQGRSPEDLVDPNVITDVVDKSVLPVAMEGMFNPEGMLVAGVVGTSGGIAPGLKEATMTQLQDIGLIAAEPGEAQERTKVTVELDEKDPNPEQTLSKAQEEIIAKRGYTPITRVDDFAYANLPAGVDPHIGAGLINLSTEK